MAHYDLYQSLQLDSNRSPAELRSTLDEQIRRSRNAAPHELEQLTVAREVIGDDRKKAMYDQQLNDPTASDITVADLRTLAAMKLDSKNADSRQAIKSDDDDRTTRIEARPNQNESATSPEEATTQTTAESWGPPSDVENADPTADKFASAKARAAKFATSSKSFASTQAKETTETFRKTPKKPLIITAISSVIITILALAGVSYAQTASSSEYKARKLTDNMLSLSNADEANEWIRENVPAAFREEVQDELKLNGSNPSFSGMDVYFSLDNPRAGQAANLRTSPIFTPGSVESETKQLEEEFDISFENGDDLFNVPIGGENGTVGRTIVTVKDGKARLVDVLKAN